jgi:hypothetical protein
VKVSREDRCGSGLKDQASKLTITLKPSSGLRPIGGRRRIRLDELAALDDQERELEPLIPFHKVLLPASLGMSPKVLTNWCSDMLKRRATRQRGNTRG